MMDARAKALAVKTERRGRKRDVKVVALTNLTEQLDEAVERETKGLDGSRVFV